MNGERSRFQRPTKRSASPFTVQGAPPPPRDERLGILSPSSRAFAHGTRVASPRRGIPGCLRQRDGRGWLCLDQDQQRRKKGETRRRNQPRLSLNPPRPLSMRDRGTKMNKLNCIRLALTRLSTGIPTDNQFCVDPGGIQNKTPKSPCALARSLAAACVNTADVPRIFLPPQPA